MAVGVLALQGDFAAHAAVLRRLGESVQVALRPEAVEMTQPRNGDAIHATVQSSTFLGDKIEYEISLGQQKLNIVRFNPERTDDFRPGETVHLNIPESSVRLVDAE